MLLKLLLKALLKASLLEVSLKALLKTCLLETGVVYSMLYRIFLPSTRRFVPFTIQKQGGN